MRRDSPGLLHLPKRMVPSGQILVHGPPIFARQKRQHGRVIINLPVIRFQDGVLVVLRMTWEMFARYGSKCEVRIHFMRKSLEEIATSDAAERVHEKHA